MRLIMGQNFVMRDVIFSSKIIYEWDLVGTEIMIWMSNVLV